MKNFKTTLLEILKQQAKQWKNYEQRFENLKELFVEQRKILTIRTKIQAFLFFFTGCYHICDC